MRLIIEWRTPKVHNKHVTRYIEGLIGSSCAEGYAPFLRINGVGIGGRIFLTIHLGKMSMFGDSQANDHIGREGPPVGNTCNDFVTWIQLVSCGNTTVCTTYHAAYSCM